MNTRGAILAVIATFFAGSANCEAASFTFDSRRVEISFTYYAGFVPQSGRFTRMDGVVDFDPENPGKGSIDAIIKTASLSANAFQAELRGEDFFNVPAFPEIRFKSRSVRAIGPNRADFRGEMTMKGVTRPVTLHATIAGGHHISGKIHIKRSDFDMTALSLLVGDEIDIQIEAELIGKQNQASD